MNKIRKYKKLFLVIGTLLLILQVFENLPLKTVFAQTPVSPTDSDFPGFIGPETAPGISSPTAKDIADELENRSAANAEETGCGGVFSFDFLCWVREGFTYLANFIGQIIGKIAAVVIKIAAAFITFLISASGDVLKSPLVTTGFRITLSLANLGFVFAIIIIAFATILRLQGYETKKLLTNLIIAAILVNFSLGIAGVFLDFSNILGSFFINEVSSENISDFAVNLVGAFSPQKLLEVQLANSNDEANGWDDLKGAITAIASIFFVAFFTVVIAIVMFGVAGALIVRYIALNFLLIVMPLAWLFWIIPQTSHLSSKWWNNFMKWIFFLPAMTFFLYLAIATTQQMGQTLEEFTKQSNLDLGLEKDVLIANPLLVFLQMITLTGILVAGLVAAQKIGISGAEGALNGAQKVRNWAVGKAKGTAGGVAGVAGRTLARQITPSPTTAQKVQNWAAGRKLGISRYGAGLISRGVAGLSKTAPQQISGFEDRIKKMSDSQKQAALLTATQPMKIAILKDLIKNQKLNDIDASRYITEDYKKVFEQYGEGKSFGDMQKTTGMNIAMNTALKAGNQEAANLEAIEFFKTFTESDKKKLQISDVFGDKKSFGLEGRAKEMQQEALTTGMSGGNPGFLGGLLSKLNAQQLENYKKNMHKSLKNLDELIVHNMKIGNDTLAQSLSDKKDVAEKSFKKHLSKRMLGLFEEEKEEEGDKKEETKKAA